MYFLREKGRCEQRAFQGSSRPVIVKDLAIFPVEAGAGVCRGEGQPGGRDTLWEVGPLALSGQRRHIQGPEASSLSTAPLKDTLNALGLVPIRGVEVNAVLSDYPPPTPKNYPCYLGFGSFFFFFNTFSTLSSERGLHCHEYRHLLWMLHSLGLIPALLAGGNTSGRGPCKKHW